LQIATTSEGHKYGLPEHEPSASHPSGRVSFCASAGLLGTIAFATEGRATEIRRLERRGSERPIFGALQAASRCGTGFADAAEHASRRRLQCHPSHDGVPRRGHHGVPRGGHESMTANTRRRHGSEQERALRQFRTFAAPWRFRVQRDAEGFPLIPGRYGRIEWHCDGVDCWSCPLPGQLALAVYTDRPRLFTRLWAIPGVKPHQTGDTEMRAVFPPEALGPVAAVIRARRRRTQTSSGSLQNLRPRVTSQPQEPRANAGRGQHAGPTEVRP
jgi:hypothetical protein